MTGPMSSQGTRVYLSTSLTAKVITAATKAAPCVLTVTTPTVLAGAYVMVTGTGWRSLDNKTFKVATVAAGAVTLEQSDTVAETTTVTGGSMYEGAAAGQQEICFATITRESPAASTLDVTTLCDAERRQLTGMKNNGTFTMNGYYDPGSPGQQLLRSAYSKGDARIISIKPPDNSEIAWTGQINQMSESFGVDAPIGITAGGLVTGNIVYTLPPGATTITLTSADEDMMAPVPETVPAPEQQPAAPPR